MLSAKKVQICSSANHSTFILWYIEALFIYSIDWFFVESWHIEGCTTYKMTSDFRWFPTEITKIRYHKICCYHIFTRNYAIISLSITSKKYAKIGNFLYSKSPINRSHINLFQTIPMIWLQYYFSFSVFVRSYFLNMKQNKIWHLSRYYKLCNYMLCKRTAIILFI